MVDGLRQLPVAASGEQRGVECLVRGIDGSRVARGHGFVVATLQRLQLRKQRGAGRQRHALRGTAVQRCTQLRDLLHLLRREITHGRAAVGCARYDAHALQLDKGLANGMPLGAEALHQRVLDEPFAWPQVAEQDIELERAHDIPDGRVGCFRDWRIGSLGVGGIAHRDILKRAIDRSSLHDYQ